MQSELTYRSPKELTLVTKAFLKQHPEMQERLDRYHSISADEGVDDIFVEQVKEAGRIILPLIVEHVEEFDLDVIVAGRKRWLAATRLGFKEIPTMDAEADNEKATIITEVAENLQRRVLSVREQGEAYRKLFVTGMTAEEVARFVGKTGARVSQILAVAEMPETVHKFIDEKKLTIEAAYNLRALGKKAAKGSGRQRIYDPKEVKEALNTMSDEARLVGGKDGKISVKHAKDSKPRSADSFTKKNWQAVYDDPLTPDDYKGIIGLYLDKLSLKQAQTLAEGNLDWLERKEPPAKPKKVKEPKVKASAGKKGKEKPAEMEDTDLAELFS